MKIKSTIIVLLSIIMLPFFANAQKQELVTYDFDSHEVSLSYGFASATRWIDDFDNSTILNHVYDDGSNWGTITLNYLYRHSDYITFGLAYTYSGLKRNIIYKGSVYGNNKVDIHTIMPQFKSNWFKSDIFTLYSKVALGVSIGLEKDVITRGASAGVYEDTKCVFAFQASPIGIEIGRKFAFFLEAGFGYQGIVNGGFRFRF